MKKIILMILSLILVFSLLACSGKQKPERKAFGDADSGKETQSQGENFQETKENRNNSQQAPVYKVGICNYVDDASLNQIADSIRARLEELETEKGVTFQVSYDNCNADANVMAQIISNFTADEVDLMVGIATPVAMAMQAASEESGIPVVFSAVSDPLSAGLVESLEEPGSNLTGTSDFLDTDAIMNLIFAADPEADTIGLLYDLGQDSSATPIKAAKAYLREKGVEVIEATGTTTDEMMLAADALIDAGVDAVFTPSDNTVMNAQLSIYEAFTEAGIPQYTGADSFALNGAFLGYGVDYEMLGVETANMIGEILVDGADPSRTPVRTFDNGTATINTETCQALGLDFEELSRIFAPFCTNVQGIVTGESFDELDR